jgi:hypothetical protein
VNHLTNLALHMGSLILARTGSANEMVRSPGQQRFPSYLDLQQARRRLWPHASSPRV